MASDQNWNVSVAEEPEAGGPKSRIAGFFRADFDSQGAVQRFAEFRKNVEADKDHVRVHGQCKRIFGPAKKQMFTCTIVGGMERRFEIIDNQVNHIPFTHEASDRHPDKCRNPRIKCRDDTRVVLARDAPADSDFIHANWVRGAPLFNDFILTQAPLPDTVRDFWRMVLQQKVDTVLMLISRKQPARCARFWPRLRGTMTLGRIQLSTRAAESRGSLLRVYTVDVSVVEGTENRPVLSTKLWQGDFNNSDNLYAPLHLLRLARASKAPTVVVDHLGISRGACLVAAEVCLSSMVRGPSYKRAVHFLRACRPFSVETPMQYVFIHRVLLFFVRPYAGQAKAFEEDYARWLETRAGRLFLDNLDGPVPPHRLLSPCVDPDLLARADGRERPNHRREMHQTVGELPQPDSRADLNPALQLPNKYPRGRRYLY